MAFRWLAINGPTLNTGLVALRLTRRSGPVYFVDFFSYAGPSGIYVLTESRILLGKQKIVYLAGARGRDN